CCGFFFFQAEDGIRDDLVTGVQTCALPIFHPIPAWVRSLAATVHPGHRTHGAAPVWGAAPSFRPRRPGAWDLVRRSAAGGEGRRSEERRVGKEGRWGVAP